MKSLKDTALIQPINHPVKLEENNNNNNQQEVEHVLVSLESLDELLIKPLHDYRVSEQRFDNFLWQTIRFLPPAIIFDAVTGIANFSIANRKGFNSEALDGVLITLYAATIAWALGSILYSCKHYNTKDSGRRGRIETLQELSEQIASIRQFFDSFKFQLKAQKNKDVQIDNLIKKAEDALGNLETSILPSIHLKEVLYTITDKDIDSLVIDADLFFSNVKQIQEINQGQTNLHAQEAGFSSVIKSGYSMAKRIAGSVYSKIYHPAQNEIELETTYNNEIESDSSVSSEEEIPLVDKRTLTKFAQV